MKYLIGVVLLHYFLGAQQRGEDAINLILVVSFQDDLQELADVV